MGYEVSKEILATLSKITNMDKVKQMLDFIKNDEEFTINEQKEITLVEAPTFEELTRANVMSEKFKALGLTDVQIDEHNNVFGYRRGKGTAPVIVLDAHLDTVFPTGSAKEVIEKDGKLYCPGICDDTRGLAAILGVLRALNSANVVTDSDIIFLATAREEGMGGLGGMRDFLADHTEVGACVCIDGSNPEGIIYEATGIRTLAVNYHGVGGHAFMAYGKVANAIHAATRGIAKLADMKLPEEPRTTFAVTNFHAGNDKGIHAIVDTAVVKLNFRSNGAEELKETEAKILKAIKEGVDEENAFWGQDLITYDIENYVDVPAGTQPQNSNIIQGVYAAIESIGCEPVFHQGGSTNANNPIGLGIPALCLGGGGTSGGVHTLEEWYDPTDSYKGVQMITTLMLLLAGLDGETKSIL